MGISELDNNLSKSQKKNNFQNEKLTRNVNNNFGNQSNINFKNGSMNVDKSEKIIKNKIEKPVADDNTYSVFEKGKNERKRIISKKENIKYPDGKGTSFCRSMEIFIKI